MNGHPKIEVSDWQETPIAIPVRTRALRGFISPTLIGVIGTILLHALILPTTYFGSRAHETHPPKLEDPSSVSADAAAATDDDLVLLPLPTPSDSNPGAQTLSMPLELGKLIFDVKSIPDPPQLSNLEKLSLDDDQPPASTAANGDAAEQTRLFGIYTGQILARINRIWRRPRTPVTESSPSATASDATFQCEAQIVQDANGNVQEVLLPRCNGSPAWQRSLVSAIQQASPLPAPPSPSVFTRSVSLSFIGLPYVVGANQDDYEINAPQLAQVRTRAQ